MTPQSTFMVIAPVLPDREDGLRALLATMNTAPGMADPANALVPFGRLDRLHVARFVILRDETLADRPAADAFDAPVWFAMLGDCDGPGDEMLRDMATCAGDGLRQIFAHCAGFVRDADLLGWLRTHSVRPAAQYVNWVGRTVRQIREEAVLHAALRAELARQDPDLPPSAIREHLVEWQKRHGPTLTAPEPTQAGWLAGHLLNMIGVPVALLLLAPFLLLYAPLFLWQLRARETSDPVVAPPVSPAHEQALAAIEDHDVSNAFSALGSVKPGRFRLWTLVFIFWVLEFSLRQIYTRGRLARVGTIHFARWVFLDDRRRLLFASNYDGSLDSYMDDFINKVAYGLNLVFSNGIGYPRTRFLLADGAGDEQVFKRYLRRHQVPTQVWYKAYPGLTTADLARNTLIREGLERPVMTGEEARQWLALI